MIIESVFVLFSALILDLSLGDPKNKFHPTAWIGSLIAKLTPLAKNSSESLEKLGGSFLILISSGIVLSLTLLFQLAIDSIPVSLLSIIISIIVSMVLLKTTIAIKGMQKHAMMVADCLKKENISLARDNLSLIVKRNTKKLDQNHIISGVIESISENTVDGITAPLFYFGLFGIPGAFVYRVVNTADSMIGYKTPIFKNIGWFGANCDKLLNFIPSRITALVIILSALLLNYNWKKSLEIMIRDGGNTASPNAGYPMAAFAGALEKRFEKVDHYALGDGDLSFSLEHIESAITLMKVTSILFSIIIVMPMVLLLSYFGWWIHA